MNDIQIIISKFFGETEVSGQEESYVKQIVNQIRLSDDGYINLINLFPKFTLNKPRYFTFHLLKNVLQNRWDKACNYKDVLINFLFEISVDINLYNKYDDITKKTCAESQAIIISQLISDEITTFDQFFAGKDSKILILFIERLCFLISTRSMPKNKLKSDFFACFCPYFLENINNFMDSTIGLDALSYFTRVFGIEWVTNDDICCNVSKAMDNIQLRCSALDVLTNVLKCSDQRSLLIIEKFGLVHYIERSLTPDVTIDFLCSLSKLVSVCGESVLSEECCSIFFGFALEFMKHENVEVSQCVVSFIDNYVSLVPDVAISAFSLGIQRLALCIRIEPLSESKLTENLTHLLFTCLYVNEETVQFLYSMLNEDLKNSQDLCGAVLMVIRVSIHYGYVYKDLGAIVDLFSSFLPNEIPVSISNLPVLQGFFCLFLCDQKIVASRSQMFLNSMISIISSRNEDLAINCQLAKILDSFLIKYGRQEYINIYPECLEVLLQTQIPDVIQICTRIISCLSNSGSVDTNALYSNAIYLLNQFCQNDPSDNSIINFLTFTSSNKIPILKEEIGIALSTFVQDFSQNNKIMNLVIKTIGEMGLDGLRILFSLEPMFINSISLIGMAAFSLCKIIRDCRSRNKVQDAELGEFMTNLFNSYISVLDDFIAKGPLPDEIDECIDMIIKFSVLIPEGPLFVSDTDVISDLMDITRDVYSRYPVPKLINNINNLCYRCCMARRLPDDILKFLPSSLNLLSDPTFDVNNRTWLTCIKLIIKVHSTLINNIPKSEKLITQAVLNIGSTQSSAVEYMGSIRPLSAYYLQKSEPPHSDLAKPIEFFNDWHF